MISPFNSALHANSHRLGMIWLVTTLKSYVPSLCFERVSTLTNSLWARVVFSFLKQPSQNTIPFLEPCILLFILHALDWIEHAFVRCWLPALWSILKWKNRQGIVYCTPAGHYEGLDLRHLLTHWSCDRCLDQHFFGGDAHEVIFLICIYAVSSATSFWGK